jgi:hypothetical protein
LTWHGYNPDEEKVPRTGPLFGVAETKGASVDGKAFLVPATEDKKEALRMTLAFHARQPIIAADGSLEKPKFLEDHKTLDRDHRFYESLRIHDATLFPKSLTQFGYAYPPYLSAFLGQTPVPMEMLVSINIQTTVPLDANNPDGRSIFYPEGVIIPEILTTVGRLRETIERHGIPCSEAFMKKRYGGSVENFTPVVPDDYEARVKAMGIRNPFNPVGGGMAAVYHKYRMASLDEAPHAVPGPRTKQLTGARYYALPGIPLKKKLPKEAYAPRADLLSAEKPEDIPYAINMTTEQGEAFILSQFDTPPSEEDPTTWIVPSPVQGGADLVPWFFWVLFDEFPATANARFPVITTPKPHVPTESEKLRLPKDMDEWRQRTVDTIINPTTTTASSSTAKAATTTQVPVTEVSVSTASIAATTTSAVATGSRNEDGEPPVKRARIDEPQGEADYMDYAQ